MGTPRRRLPRPEPVLWPEPGHLVIRDAKTHRRYSVTFSQAAELEARSLGPVRRVANYRNKRSVPRQPYLYTVGGHVLLDSGLEQDLAYDLDRDPAVKWIVPQAVLLPTPLTPDQTAHYIDLLSTDALGQVTLWVVRPADFVDDRLLRVVDEVKATCGQIGWAVELFTGHTSPRRENLTYLRAFRRRPPWADPIERDFRLALSGRVATIGELLGIADDRRDRLTVLAHLLWTTALTVDFDAPIVEDTAVWPGPVWAV